MAAHFSLARFSALQHLQLSNLGDKECFGIASTSTRLHRPLGMQDLSPCGRLALCERFAEADSQETQGDGKLSFHPVIDVLSFAPLATCIFKWKCRTEVGSCRKFGAGKGAVLEKCELCWNKMNFKVRSHAVRHVNIDTEMDYDFWPLLLHYKLGLIQLHFKKHFSAWKTSRLSCFRK